MEIEKIQEKIVKFAKQRAEQGKFNLDEEPSLIHLTEELGEVSRQIFNKKARPEKFNENNLKEEVCDVILESLILANLLNVDLPKELSIKIEELNKRFNFQN